MDDDRLLRYIPEVLRQNLTHVVSPSAATLCVAGEAVLFIVAWWSGPAIEQLQQLVAALVLEDSDGRIRLLVADTDECVQLAQESCLRGRLHGWGETVWLSDGRIVEVLSGKPPAGGWSFAHRVRALVHAAVPANPALQPTPQSRRG